MVMSLIHVTTTWAGQCVEGPYVHLRNFHDATLPKKLDHFINMKFFYFPEKWSSFLPKLLKYELCEIET
jgi:hypothetical protein